MSGFTQKLNQIGGFESGSGGNGGGGGGHKLSHNLLLRLWSLVNCALLAFVGCAGISWFSLCPPYVRWVVLAVACLVALVVPSIGVVIAMIALGLAFVSQGAYLCGAAMIVGAFAWWSAVGRRGAVQSCTMASVSTFGSFGCGSVTPLLSGLYLKPVDAVFNAIFSGVLAGGLAALGTLQITGWQAQNVLPVLWGYAQGAKQAVIVPSCDQMLIAMVTAPAFWITLACWVLAAVVTSAISGEGGRVRQVVGVLVGSCFVIGGLVLQTYLATGGAVYAPSQAAILTCVIVVAIALAFVFLRR